MVTYAKISPKSGEPQRYSWGTPKKKKKAICSMMFHSRLVHSPMLSSHRFLCLPLRLPPCIVPCRTVLSSPDDGVTCPYHFSLHLFTLTVQGLQGPSNMQVYLRDGSPATLRHKLQIKHSISPSHSILTPGQHQGPGRVATRVPIFKSLV